MYTCIGMEVVVQDDGTIFCMLYRKGSYLIWRLALGGCKPCVCSAYAFLYTIRAFQCNTRIYDVMPTFNIFHRYPPYVRTLTIIEYKGVYRFLWVFFLSSTFIKY